MTETIPSSPQQIAKFVSDVFSQHMPFNQLLGLQIKVVSVDKVEVHFPWQDSLMGNPIQKILHGGVTAAVLDTVGGVMAVLYAVKDLPQLSEQSFQDKLSRMSTIDMRVDYLRPGKGEQFIASAEVIRKGAKVAVCRMELHNQDGTHIAFGTGTYMIG